MIHISEIAPGRIRNLRDYVKEDRRIVCKVLDINRVTNNIDLSLRRVSTSAMLEKLNDYKQEEKAEKLLESVGKQFKTDLKHMYDAVGIKVLTKYPSLYSFFQTISVKGKDVLDSLDIPKNYKDALAKIAAEKIKPVEVKVGGTLSLKTYADEGILLIKKLLLDLQKGGANVHYLGAPKYKLEITSTDYKTAETQLKHLTEKTLEEAEHNHIEATFSKNA